MSLPEHVHMALETHALMELELREANRQLVDLVADSAFENFMLRSLWEGVLCSRIHGDATIERLQRRNPS